MLLVPAIATPVLHHTSLHHAVITAPTAPSALYGSWQSVQQQVLPDCPLVLSYNGTPTSKTTLPRALEKLSNLAGVHRIKIHALRHSHASLLISMGENPLLIKERLGHEKIQTTLGTYGHLYPNTNLEVAKKLTGILQVQSATESIANYTSNQHTAIYHRTVEEK